jgi:poly-D-alanine transfer protein DltD
MSNKDDEKDLHSVTQVQVDDSNDLSPEYHEYQELATKFDDSRLKALCVGLPLTLGWKSSS